MRVWLGYRFSYMGVQLALSKAIYAEILYTRSCGATGGAQSSMPELSPASSMPTRLTALAKRALCADAISV